MPLALADTILAPLQSWAHAIVPVQSAAFDALAWVSLACYLLFAMVSLHDALKPWADKVLLGAMGAATAASLVLHLSIRSTPSDVGEGALWKFVSVSQYLPWVVISLGLIYVVYRLGAQLLKSHR
jgi:hypothetical protein